MTLLNQIFPSDRDERLVQTQWASDWLDGAAGFGYAANCLMQHVTELGALIDQAGLAIFFLQRHRVELALKGLLDAVGADVPNSHDLDYLWTHCEATVEPRDPDAWATFRADHHELVQVLNGVDQSSFTFRYPVDTKGAKATRPEFIDLAILDKHVKDLHSGVSGYVGYLTESSDDGWG